MRLIEIAQQNHRAVFLIEHANDVERIKIQGTVGITAAASAPERIVQEVLKLLQSNRY